MPFQYNLTPEIGLPTPEGEVKRTTFAMLKEQNRLKRLQTDNPKYLYLIETIANLARSILNLTATQTPF